MADPVITDHYRALVVFKTAGTADPRERFMNGFVFRNDEIQNHAGAHADIVARLEDFYNGAHGPSGEQITDFMSPGLDTTAEITTYDLGQAPPRDPITSTWTPSFVAPGVSVLPAELAICASYGATTAPRTAASTTGNPVPRRQRTGRIYLGPLQGGVLEPSAGQGNTREINPAVVETVALASEALATESLVNRVRWVLLSNVLSDTYVIDYGWVDDAFDIQRRRGTPALTREEWAL